MFEAPELAYRVPPQPITHGTDTHIFEFELGGEIAPNGLVLRVFRDPSALDRARREAVVQNALAGCGYPAARVLDVAATGVLDRPFILMERLPGSPLLAEIGSLGTDGGFRIASAMAILREAAILPFVPRLLAHAQHRLHALDTRILTAALGRAGIPEEELTVDAHLQSIAQAVEGLQLDALAELLAWLRHHRPVESRRVICHGDMQPMNVMSRRSQITGVVDWSWATLAEPELDVGFANAQFATAPVDAPRYLEGVLAGAQRQFAQAYLRAARRDTLDSQKIEYYQVLWCARAIEAIARRRSGDAYQPFVVWDTEAGVHGLDAFVRAATRPRSVGFRPTGPE